MIVIARPALTDHFDVMMEYESDECIAVTAKHFLHGSRSFDLGRMNHAISYFYRHSPGNCRGSGG
jgi:hypothetical protein